MPADLRQRLLSQVVITSLLAKLVLVGSLLVISRWSIKVSADARELAEDALREVAASVTSEELEESPWANLYLDSHLVVEDFEGHVDPEVIADAKQAFKDEVDDLLRKWRVGELEPQGEDRLDNQASVSSAGGSAAGAAPGVASPVLPAYLSRLISSQGEAAAEQYLASCGAGLSLSEYFDQQLTRAAAEQPHMREAIARCRSLDDADKSFHVELLALASAGLPGSEVASDWSAIQGDIGGRLSRAGLQPQAREVLRQQLVDISSPGARERYLQRALDPGARLAAASCLPPDLVLMRRPAESREVFDYIMAHELAHKISFLQPELEGFEDDSGWLMAEPFNDLRAIQLAAYDPGSMRPVVDAGLEVAFGLASASGLPPRFTLELSDYEMEQRMAAGLSLSMSQWREQVTQPFDRQLNYLNQLSGPKPEASTRLFIAGMSPHIQELILKHGPGFRSVPLLG